MTIHNLLSVKKRKKQIFFFGTFLLICFFFFVVPFAILFRQFNPPSVALIPGKSTPLEWVFGMNWGKYQKPPLSEWVLATGGKKRKKN